MEFEWDEAKSQSNLEKHGIDFNQSEAMFDGRATVTFPANSVGEARSATTGEIDELLYTAIWTRRGDAIRIISVRRARDAERRKYRSAYE
jgi:uncharacterized protein